MGIHGSDTHSLMFSDVVPKKIELRWFWFQFAMGVLNGGRIGVHLSGIRDSNWI
jgi:hypothetical protein